MKATLKFILNGNDLRLDTETQRSLLEVLREDLKMTGTKYGCGEGQCRACTVLIDGKPTPSCLLRMEAVEGRSIETIEGLADSETLHPVQEAFIEEGAMQCGYCVPGMILNAVGLLRQTPNPTESEIVAAMNGNLCRCCGYGAILKAVRRAAQSSTDEVTQ